MKKIIKRMAWLLVILIAGLSCIVGLFGIIWAIWLWMHGYDPIGHYAIGLTGLIVFTLLWWLVGDDL
ncbi:hypothetical protein [Bifidobacterium tissieri]|uniref:hypothetical protein n=1 Tax=Bifidobacterium tissieri TaxID=1630162 RepID=UPI00168BD8BC|nr:hypothetical protein [Bifidobacterium tissieri]